VLLFGEASKHGEFNLDPSRIQTLGSRGNHRLWRVQRGDLSEQASGIQP
jgi:hypothetical protein